MISKSDSRCAVARFCYHSYDYIPNWTPLSPITITYRAVFKWQQLQMSSFQMTNYAITIATFSDWFKDLVPIFQPSKIESNRTAQRFLFFKQVRGRVKPLLCELLETELSGLDNRESGQLKIWVAMSQEEKKITFAHAVIQQIHKSLLENHLQLSKSIFFKSVLSKLTKNLFTSV